ncbi:MAG: hypothetical protein M3459_07790 [Actinomycetota bacterium]|nr:hypothetical protein [Actinomycetota bacterium]
MSRDLHRFEAQATIVPGEHELCGDTLVQLVTVALSDGGPITRDEATSTYQRPDVFCPLRPAEARQLAAQLLELADHADQLTRR